MSRARTAAIIKLFRSTLQTVDNSLTPDEADKVYEALASHVRSRRPESIEPMSLTEDGSRP